MSVSLRRSFALTAIALAGCLHIDLSVQPREGDPNIVVIFVDDLGYADLGVTGALGYATPNLDKLAADGVLMTDFYVSQPVCSASRASLLTGCYANRIGIAGALGPDSKRGLHASEVTLAELCKSRNYATAIYGKWHLGHHFEFLPERHGFDEFYGIPYSNDMWPFHPETPQAWPDLPTMDGSRVVGLNLDQNQTTVDLTRRAVDFIERKADRPFFLYVSQPMPHVPLHVSDERRGTTVNGLYGDVISELDWSVGQILAALRRNNLDENTLVIFTSDNGPWLSYGNHAGSAGSLREGKGTTFEGGVRVPFIARWKGTIPAGVRCSEPAMTIDVFPTVARLLNAGLPPRQIDGKDIWPLLTGVPGAKSPHEALFFYYNENDLEALRSGSWKLHFPHRYRTMNGRPLGQGGVPGQYNYAAETPLALFDLSLDRGETTNVADQHPEVVERLTRLADQMRRELGDDLTQRDGNRRRKPGIHIEPRAR